jgi:SRSO17 transposase
MSTARTPIETIGFIDDYCAFYRHIFPDVRSFEQFKLFHVGLISEPPRKSIPAISKAVGLDETQSLHHFVANSPWQATDLRHMRLTLTCQALRGRGFTLCIDKPAIRRRGAAPITLPARTSGIWARSRMALFLSMRMASWIPSPSR